MKTVVIIPARYSSTRFPGKPLIKLLGKPMVIWVAEIASLSVGKENVDFVDFSSQQKLAYCSLIILW